MDDPLLVNFRFSVSFLSWGGQDGTVDTRFQHVSGLGGNMTLCQVKEVHVHVTHPPRVCASSVTAESCPPRTSAFFCPPSAV